MLESWKKIPSIAHCEASDLGRIKINDRLSIGGCRGVGNTCVKLLKSKILSQSLAGRYNVVRIGKKNYYVHRLVAEAWHINHYKKPQVNHINGDRTNNCASNLEWATSKENVSHAWSSGLCKKRQMSVRERIELSERKKKKVINIETGQVFNSITDASIFYKIPLSTMSINIKEGKCNFKKIR